jgi:hypothetical protein
MNQSAALDDERVLAPGHLLLHLQFHDKRQSTLQPVEAQLERVHEYLVVPQSILRFHLRRFLQLPVVRPCFGRFFSGLISGYRFFAAVRS